MGRAEDRAAVEREHRQLPGEPEEVWEVLVGLLLPTRRPHHVEPVRKAPQQLAGVVPDAVDDPVDRVERARRRAVHGEVEQADHAVDIEEQDWPVCHELCLPAVK